MKLSKKTKICNFIYIIGIVLIGLGRYFSEYFDSTYLSFLILAIAILLFIYGAYSILNNQSTENCGKVSKIIKIGMLIAFLAFAFGTFNGL